MNKSIPFLLFMVLSAGIILLTCGFTSPETRQMASKTDISDRTVPSRQQDFFLPEHLYAVPGIECNIYFRNIFLAVNHANYNFDVNCKFGRHDLRRWRYTPKAEDAGKSFPLIVEVSDGASVVAIGKTMVHVAPVDAGKGREINILMVGDSLTNATIYPMRLHTLCQGADNPKLIMLGTRSVGWSKPIPGGVAHEGYGGWCWDYFFPPETVPATNADMLQKYRATSRFWMLKDGKPVFSLANYLKTNNFKMPDVITFQLGVNDVFCATPENREKMIAKILDNAERLIAAFRREAPDALIGVGFVTPGAGQDAFGRSCGCGQTAWGYYNNHFRLNQAMAKRFVGREKLVMIPVNVNLDTENNFPTEEEAVNEGNPAVIVRQSNGLHPTPAGYRQMGDVYYAWLKYQLATKSPLK